LWYRGNVGCPEITEIDRLQPVLKALGASRVVIGHTPTVTRDVVARLGGRVIEIDTGMLNVYYKGSGHALVMSGDNLAVVAEDGKTAAVGKDPRPLGQSSLGEEALLNLLETGDVVLGAAIADGSIPAAVTLGDRRVDALFVPNRSRRSVPDVAAYRLDRLLGLQLVPAAVERTVDSRRGVLQAIPNGAVTEEQRIAARAGAAAWCPLERQWDAMFVFDTLIQKDIRAQQEIYYDRESWKLFLIGHRDAFGTGRKPPRYLAETTLTVTDAWRDALRGLDKARAEKELGDVLGAGQIRALLRRRDALLEEN